MSRRTWKHALFLCLGLPMVLAAPGAAKPKAEPATGGLGEPLAELPDGRPAWEKGKALFKKRFTTKEGIGPLFNDVSCATCHAQPVLGGGGDLRHTAALAALGDKSEPHFFRRRSTSGPTPVVPPHADKRIPPALYGLGLIEAIPDETIRSQCGAGHVNVVDGHVARFGYKPFVTNLDDFVSQAALTEMGLTTQRNLAYAEELRQQAEGSTKVAALKPKTIDGDNVRDPEMDDQTLKSIGAFIRGLQPPARDGTHPAGEALFKSWGCANCHRPQTAPGVEAYSDLCLHHMGRALDDGIKDRDAGTDEYRTALLWGLRFRKLLLHDGRAKTPAEAIAQHDGEAAPAAAKWRLATEQERADLLAFLKTL